MPAHPPRPHRIVTSAAAAVTVTALLAACTGGGGGGASGPADYAPPAEDISADLTYAVWDQTQVEAIEANLEGFTEQYPNIDVSVDVTPFDSYFTKLQTQASSDTLPDLFWINGPNFRLYAENGQIAPITGAVEAGDIDPADYPEALVDLYTSDDVLYGVPKDFDTIGLWYNRAIFEQADVDEPTADWTWEDVQSTATEISERLTDDGVYGVVGGMDGQTTYYDTIFQAGGSVLTEDGTGSGYASPEAQAGIGFWRDLIASEGSPTIQQLTDTPADQWFVSGKAAMFYSGSWSRTAIADSPVADDVQVVPLPQGERRATVIHGVMNAVAASGQNVQAAQALQVYLAGQEAQQQQGDLGAVIPAFEGTQDAFAQSYEGVDLQIFLDEVENAQPLPSSANTAAWNAIETELLPGVFAGDQPVAPTLDTLSTRMDEALAAE